MKNKSIYNTRKPMQSFFIFLYMIFVCILSTNLKAIDPQNMQDEKNDVRILELLPNLLCPFAVAPGIPDDFLALSPKGTLDPHDWIYWGPQDVLKEYFENPDSLKVPVLRVKVSANLIQIGYKKFSDEEILKKLKKEDPKFDFIETLWGDYPVVAIKAKVENKLILTAWVGLNDPETRCTLMFNLVYPEKTDHPNKEDLQLWENLLTKTTQLKDGDFFKACGQDLQEGFTIINVGGAKLKMLAEKRQRDGKIQVVVIPESSDTKFHYFDMIEGAMGAKWRYGEPLVKVYGTIVIKRDNFESNIDHVTSIFVKSVPEFSVTKENGNNLLIFSKNMQ